MNKTTRFRSETLNAYLDGELDPAEADCLRQAAACDETLKQHLDELRRERAFTRARPCAGRRGSRRTASPTGRQPPPEPVRSSRGHARWRRPSPRRRLRARARRRPGHRALSDPAATHRRGRRERRRARGLSAAPRAGHPAAASLGIEPATARGSGCSFTSATTTPRHCARGLRSDREAAGPDYRRRQTGGGRNPGQRRGLRLLRDDTAAAAERERIARLRATYPNLRFLACGNTLQRLELEKGLKR